MPTKIDPVFPLEIFQLIINNLAPSLPANDLDNLRTCSLVCKAFLALSQPFLIRKITIGPSTSDSRDHISQLLTDQPRLQNYVKHLSYHIEYDDEAEDEEEPADGRFACFLNLKNVQSLEIESLYGSREYEVDSHHAPNIYCYSTVMKHYLFSGTLTKLTLTMIRDVPLPLILTSPVLTTLELVHCDSTDWSDQVLPISELEHRVPTLETLILFGYDGTDIRTLAYCPSLTNLTIGVGTSFRQTYNRDEDGNTRDPFPRPLFPALKQLRHLFENQSSTPLQILDHLHTVEQLVFILGHEMEGSPTYSQYANNLSQRLYLYHSRSHLRKFCVYSHINFHVEEIVRCIGHELLGVKAVNIIESLEFILCLKDEPNFFRHIESSLVSWKLLDNTLLETPNSFPKLQHVSITFVIIRSQEDEPDAERAKKVLEVAPMLRGALTRLYAASRITTTVTAEMFEEGKYHFPGDLEYGRYSGWDTV